ncbi:MAG TPA: GNAT family N-acetyltransferase [Ramlibacter sp.]|nr:GNAT family N-acetyltransferase [Ramlibacter sp.]
MQDFEFADNTEDHRYEMRQGGTPVAIAEYAYAPGVVKLIHTEVLPGNEGQGLGGKIAKAVLADIGGKGLNVVPECSYMAGYIKKNADQYLQLVREEDRKMLDSVK